jgi:hypothetical protein
LNRKKENNEYKRFKQNQGHNVTGTVLTDEELKQTFGMSPWELINDIFKRVDIPYETNNPEGNAQDSEFSLILMHKSKPDTTIKF